MLKVWGRRSSFNVQKVMCHCRKSSAGTIRCNSATRTGPTSCFRSANCLAGWITEGPLVD